MARLYTVKEAAEETGYTDGAIYQKIADGSVPTATEQEKLEAGVPPFRKPRHYLTEQTVQALRSAPRSTYRPPSGGSSEGSW
jgi:hypothetical protein